MVRALLMISLIFLSNAVTRAAEEIAGEPSPELRAFAQQLVKIMETQDRQAFADLIDFEHLVEQSSYSKCEYDAPSSKTMFFQGFAKMSRDIEKPFYQKFMPKSDLISVVQIKSINAQESQILLRFFDGKRSDFMAFRVTADAAKTFRIIDLGDGSSAGTFAAGLEVAVLAMHPFSYIKTLGPYQPQRAWLTKNADVFADYIKAYSTHDDATRLINLYPLLPPAIQKMPLIEYHYYRANALVEHPVLKLEALRAYYAKHRDPGSLQLVLEYCRRHEDLDSLLATYDEFDKLLGKDPLNNMHRASVLVDEDRFPQAYECARQLVKDYPEWPRSHVMLMIVALLDKNNKLTLEKLQLLRDKFHLNLQVVETKDDYESFRKSPEYGVWKKENDAAAVKQDKE